MGERTTYRNSQLHKAFCEVLIEARQRAKMTQYDVSAAIERPPDFSNKVEHGTRLLNAMELVVYCRAIKTTASKVCAEVEGRVIMKRVPLR